MFAIYRIDHGRRYRVAHGFPSFRDALDYAKANYAIAWLEVDPDLPAAAADFITIMGTTYAVEAQ